MMFDKDWTFAVIATPVDDNIVSIRVTLASKNCTEVELDIGADIDIQHESSVAQILSRVTELVASLNPDVPLTWPWYPWIDEISSNEKM